MESEPSWWQKILMVGLQCQNFSTPHTIFYLLTSSQTLQQNYARNIKWPPVHSKELRKKILPFLQENFSATPFPAPLILTLGNTYVVGRWNHANPKNPWALMVSREQWVSNSNCRKKGTFLHIYFQCTFVTFSIKMICIKTNF